ncbi:MAG TPA: hypothetical protein VFR37_22410 [Longimicrobium sp.]|nr:hypothetical protein [Longimicrobium sp.]
MRRSLSLALIALSASAPCLEAQRCPPNQAARFRPTLRHGELRLAGTYRAPFEFVCGAPATVRVSRTGAELVAVLEADAGCPQAGQVRWRGLLPGPAQATFPARAAGAGGRMAEATGRIADLCTIEITANRRTSAYHRVDPACPGEARPVVVFIGGFADALNRNVARVFCGYDAAWERTHKLYFPYDGDPRAIRDAVVRHAGTGAEGAPVVLVGHSYGGDAAHRLADSLAADVDVRVLVTLDPVSGEWQGRAAPRPAGVERWINVRVGSAPGLSSCGLTGMVGGAWGPQTAADADLRFPPDPAEDDPDDDHCKTEQMFLLDEVQAALAAVR